MVAEWEFEFNDLTLGGEQPIQLSLVTGLNPPDVRVDADDKMENHGGFVFAAFLSTRIITLTGDIAGSTPEEFESQVNLLRLAFAPRYDDLPLTFFLAGQSEQRRIYCRPTRLFYDVNPTYSINYSEFTVQLVAGDPRIYSDSEYSIEFNPLTTNGMIFDVIFDLTFGGGYGGQGSIFNAGTFPTWPNFIIRGPANTPRIQNLTSSRDLLFNIVLGETDFLEINSGDKTVMLNGEASRYRTLDSISEWFEFMPGTTDLQFVAEDTGPGTSLEVRWRNAWQ